MKIKYLLLITTFFLLNNFNLLSQPIITNYYNYNDVFAIAVDNTNNEVWLGTKSGVLVRNLSGNYIAEYNKRNMNNEGLSSNFITSIAIDNYNGRTDKWFGSANNGVTLFDGINWTIYNEDNSNMSNHVNAIAVESDNTIWFATPEGVKLTNGSGSFDEYTHDGVGNDFGEVSDIYFDVEHVYCAAQNGLFVYSINNGTWSMHRKDDMNINGFELTSVVARDEFIYVGSNGGGVSIFDGVTWVNYQSSSYTLNNYVNYLSLNASGRLYAATSNNVYYFESETWEQWLPDFMQTQGFTSVIKCDNSNYVWVGFGKLGFGVSRAHDNVIADADVDNYIKAETISKTDINDIIINPSNNDLYIATEGGGISVFDGVSWSYFKNNNQTSGVIPSDDVREIAISTANDIWCATNAGVGVFDGNDWITYTTINSDLPSDNIRAIEFISSTDVWVGTDEGASCFSGTWENFNSTDGMLNAAVVSIAIDTNNDIWCLHENGVSVYNGSGWSTYTNTDMGLSSDAFLTQIDDDKNNGVWIGCTEGVVHYTGGSNWDIYKTDNGLVSNEVVSVFVDDANVKHFGTKGNGISIYNDSEWSKIIPEQGLATGFVKAVYFDQGRSTIWSGGSWGGLSASFLEEFALTASSSEYIICLGNVATITAEPSGGFGDFTYEWESDPEGFTADTKVIDVSPSENTIYTVIVKSGIDEMSSSVAIEVISLEASLILGEVELCEGASDIVYSVTPDSYRTYNWSVQGGEITQGANSDMIHVNWHGPNDNATVNLLEKHTDNQCAVSTQVGINIGELINPEILLKGENLLICTDSGLSDYQWLHNEIIIEGAKNQFYSIPTNTNQNQGSYSLQTNTSLTCTGFSNIIQIGGSTTKLFPNPTSEIINIEVNNELFGNGIVKIRDTNGKTIYIENFIKQNRNKLLSINLDSNLYGIYNIDIYINDKFCFSKKMIVN